MIIFSDPVLNPSWSDVNKPFPEGIPRAAYRNFLMLFWNRRREICRLRPIAFISTIISSIFIWDSDKHLDNPSKIHPNITFLYSQNPSPSSNFWLRLDPYLYDAWEVAEEKLYEWRKVTFLSNKGVHQVTTFVSSWWSHPYIPRVGR